MYYTRPKYNYTRAFLEGARKAQEYREGHYQLDVYRHIKAWSKYFIEFERGYNSGMEA